MSDYKLKNIFSEIDLTISTIEVKLNILKSQTQLVQHYVKGSLGDSVTQPINSLDMPRYQLEPLPELLVSRELEPFMLCFVVGQE